MRGYVQLLLDEPYKDALADPLEAALAAALTAQGFEVTRRVTTRRQSPYGDNKGGEARTRTLWYTNEGDGS